MKPPFSILVFFAILFATVTAAAQVYKWVDKDGKIQYSDVPPPEAKTTPKKLSAVAPSTAAAPASAAAKPGKAPLKDAVKEVAAPLTPAEKAAKEATEAASAKVDAENCKVAQDNLRLVESGAPLKKADASGAAVFMTQEERDAEASRARALAKSSCK
jgi:hypothetical protein